MGRAVQPRGIVLSVAQWLSGERREDRGQRAEGRGRGRVEMGDGSGRVEREGGKWRCDLPLLYLLFIIINHITIILIYFNNNT